MLKLKKASLLPRPTWGKHSKTWESAALSSDYVEKQNFMIPFIAPKEEKYLS